MTCELIALEDKYGAHNYHPLPVALSKGEGVIGMLMVKSILTFYLLTLLLIKVIVILKLFVQFYNRNFNIDF